MIGLILSVLIFNILAFKTNKRFTANQIVHIWMFTIAAQHIFDVFINFKFHGYWYFTQETDWQGIFAYTVLIPPDAGQLSHSIFRLEHALSRGLWPPYVPAVRLTQPACCDDADQRP